LQPVLAILAMMTVVAQSDLKHRQIKGLAQGLQALFGFGILALALSQEIRSYVTSHTPIAVRSVFLAPVLSAMSLPWLYMLLVLRRYEELFWRLKIGPQKATGLKWYAIRKTVSKLRLRADAIQIFTQIHALDLMQVQEREDVDRLLADGC